MDKVEKGLKSADVGTFKNIEQKRRCRRYLLCLWINSKGNAGVTLIVVSFQMCRCRHI